MPREEVIPAPWGEAGVRVRYNPNSYEEQHRLPRPLPETAA